ncbi:MULTISPECIES: chromate transporter [Cytobacillus]|jgi:chromate transporter|uniref:Transporter n=2 Tax=Cytobacillus oceanisediminis TaxID=665099 RepID=A0A160MGR0_9BACI|nr:MULTISPECIES: chromate transporter [Cytobacillus]EFV78503.1 chromate transporter [Bacillus sp. 2_A_57_CT2]MBY0158783.1 chromate transporter [Cytobacillus firmus]AND42204.1 transporter [Cytobacillus oceanisediminis 2691]MBU8771548.1 chromate transporter [Cytobacillus oceanisediminis]MCM3391437.1 chromate transporter [Cytobacillus oceanisediminis]
MIYVQIFLAFFIPGILGYGGGPSSIPLIEHEVVDNYEWMTTNEFSEMLAMGNALPGPIATKMAGYIGYEQGGVLGSIIGVFATVAPSMILMLALLGLLMRYKESPRVKRMTNYIRPIIAVLLGVMTYDFLFSSYDGIGIWQTLFIGLLSFFLLEKLKVHPAFVIAGALVYGGIFLA